MNIKKAQVLQRSLCFLSYRYIQNVWLLAARDKDIIFLFQEHVLLSKLERQAFLCH